MENQLINHCKRLTNFSKNPDLKNINSVISSLTVLCRQKALLKVELQGYIKCFICFRLAGDRQKILCNHVVHKNCLETKAKIMSNGTFDPSALIQLQCGFCNKMITQQQYTNIIGKRKITAYQTQANQQLQEQLRLMDLEQRRQQLAKMQFQCSLCLQMTLISDGITMSCSHNHRFCKDCSKEMILQQLKQGKFESNAVVCKTEGCNEVLDQLLIRNCIGNDEFQKFISIQYKNLKVDGIQFRQCGGYLYKNGQHLVQFKENGTKKQYETAQEELQRKCKAIQSQMKDAANLKGQVIKCQTRISFDSKSDAKEGFVKCPTCFLQSCIKGCLSAHRGNTCEKYKQWQVVNEQGQKFSLQQIRAMGMAQCQNPRCMMPILKNVGCDHVTCKCGFQICYRCSVPWRNCQGRCPKR